MNALAKLAGTLKYHIEPRRLNADKDEFAVAICKAQRIIAELSKEFEPIDVNSVKPSEDGRKHLSDYIKACDNRRCEIMIRCRAIAEEGADNEQ